jgi:GNAT superfamily N-acetyltransferase
MNVRVATIDDASAVSAVLKQAAEWLEYCGKPLWPAHMFSQHGIISEMGQHIYFVADHPDDGIVGTFRYQLSDPEFWPEASSSDSAFIHRVAVLRSHAGKGISRMMLDHAKQIATSESRSFLRLDCAADRPKLRAIYENNGFRWHSNRVVGPYHVSRYEWKNENS